MSNDVAYVPLKNIHRSILLATTHQSDRRYFCSINQCGSMVLSNVVRSAIITPNEWDTRILHQNMIEGDNIHKVILARNKQINPKNLTDNRFIESRHFNVIRDNFSMYGETFQIDYPTNGYFGILDDNIDLTATAGTRLIEALQELFKNHNSAIFIAADLCFGIIMHNNKLFFTDSHSCHSDGTVSVDGGVGCVIQCENIEDITNLCKQRVLEYGHSLSKEYYHLDYIDVYVQQKQGNSHIIFYYTIILNY